jgi:DNA polymerase (family 10)
MSIQELAEQAKARGFHTIAVTDHSKSSGIANGLSEERLRAHIDTIRSTTVKGITILAGSEVDILSDGSLDYDDDLLAELDVVVASPHVALDQDAKSANARILKAIEHPLVHIIGHPRGRLINRREGLPLDLPMLAAAAKEHGVALELNANWQRLDLNDTDLRTARAHDALITIDCDVHAVQDFENLRYGVLTARRGGLAPAACPNTWGEKALHDWLKVKR